VYHGGTPPIWVGVLMLAREWGTPPWEIAGGSKVVWLVRWLELTRLLGKKAKADGG